MFNECLVAEKVTEIIEDMDLNEQYSIFTEYCQNNNLYDDMPEYVDNIDDLASGMSPTEILEKFGDIDLSWNYFCFNGYGNVEEWNGIDYISEVVDYIIENEDSLYNDDIQEVLDNYSNTELYFGNEDFKKIADTLDSKEIEFEYNEEEATLTILSEDYDELTEILDEMEIEY